MALSAPRLKRKRVIKVKLETDKGTKVSADQAIFVLDPEIQLTSPVEERPGTGLYRGHSAKGVHGEASGVCRFGCELRGSGASGLEPGLAILLQAAGFKKTAETYNLHSAESDDKCISLDYWEDGKKKGLAGAVASVTFEGDTGKKMMCNFELNGIWQTPTDEALPAYAPTATLPMLLKNGTFTLGGESIKITHFALEMGVTPVPRYDVNAAAGIANYCIADYQPVVRITAEDDLVAGYDYYGILAAGTEAAISLVLNDGTDKVTFTIPKVQLREINESDNEGIAMVELAGQCNHSSGNDAITIAAAAAA